MSKRIIARFRAAALITAMLLTAPAEANRFRDNPEHVIDRARALWSSPIGELEAPTSTMIENGPRTANSRNYGTGFLISPRYIMTAAHVVYGDDLTSEPGKDYRMIFRVGRSPGNAAFAGHTTATPILSGNRDATGRNDWTILQLEICVGRRPDLGWFEPGKANLQDLQGTQAIAVGFGASSERGALSIGRGKILELEVRSGLYRTDATILPGESGGPILALDHGTMVVAGTNVAERGEIRGATYDHYSSHKTNLIIDVSKILAKPYLEGLLDSDKAAFGQPNPAAERLRMDHLPL